jgi:hypothetical protein
MPSITTGLSRGTRRALIAGIVLLGIGLGNRSPLLALVAVGVLIAVGRIVYVRQANAKALQTPWPWPADLRSAAEALARPIDPTPKRLLPPHENASLVAQVATTDDALARLIADKPAAWPWAVFTSVLVLRRRAVQARLRTIASGYQPRPGTPLNGPDYTRTVGAAMRTLAAVAEQLEQFVTSPAFKGAFGEDGGGADERSADAEAIVHVANRMMDYHQTLLTEAETCVQTPAASDLYVFVQDTSALVLVPLVGFDEFIETLCNRIGQAQELLPYAGGSTIQLDDVAVSFTVPDGLTERIGAQINRFGASA